ncbi:MAG: outer membrane lipoprotein-sorting protein, partial [Nitrospinae bacterium]|nr:outer membrane lipoprotein-sorting protein [Nitrospinota bacterium]
MKLKAYLSAGLFLVSLLAFLPLSQGAPPGTIGYRQGDYLDVSKQTWIEYPTPLKDPLGHPTRPWQPKGEFPWKQPYTATMLIYLSRDHDIYASKYEEFAANSARLNKRGLLTQRKTYVKLQAEYDHYRDVMQYDEDKDGKVGTGGQMSRRLVIVETPADVRGQGQLQLIFLNSPVAGWKMDNTWTYSPGLRRVTRSQGGDRQDEVLGSATTFDDLGSRQVWEEEHFLIGEDVLYMQMLDPQMVAPDRRVNTGDLKKDGEWIVRNMKPDRGEERISPYRPDGGIECWVVLSQWAKRMEKFGSQVFPNPKDYYLKYRISWIEKITKVAVRQEQYDHSGRLIKGGMSFNPEIFAGEFVSGGGNIRTQLISYDYRRHFRSWAGYNRPLTGPQAKAPDDWYTPEHLFREYFWQLAKIPLMKGIEEFTPAPELYRAKFPKYRKGTSDWLFKSKEDMEYMWKTWKNHGFTDEEIDTMMNGDGVIRKEGKYFPVRHNFRPAFLFEGKPLPVKFENPGPYPITK